MTKLAVVLSLVLAIFATNAAALDLAETTSPARLDGEWKLDWDRSDSVEPAMTALETPWLLRKLAGIASVSLELRAEPVPVECDECVQKVIMTMDTPLSTKEIEIILDGKPRPGEDPLGRETLDQYRWTSAEGLEMIRELELPSGSQARIREVRHLGPDRETLLSEMTVWVDGTERASMKRVLARTSD
jgi:hypothetical protein